MGALQPGSELVKVKETASSWDVLAFRVRECFEWSFILCVWRNKHIRAKTPVRNS